MKKVNRILAILFALGFMFLALLIVVELIFERAGAGPAIVNWHSIYDWMGSRTWDSRSVRIIGGLCALGGLVLLGLQLIPRKKERLKGRGGRDEIDAAIARGPAVRTRQQGDRRRAPARRGGRGDHHPDGRRRDPPGGRRTAPAPTTPDHDQAGHGEG